MKLFPLIRSAALAVSVLSIAGCNQDEFLGNNINPNQPTAVSPGVLLTSIEAHTAFTAGGILGQVNELFVQHTTGLSNDAFGYGKYNIVGAFNNEWQLDLYAGTLQDTQKLIDQTQETSPAYAGIAKILQAYNYALTTDLWGDVPYSEALRGDVDLLQPRFDKQEDIYKGNPSLGIRGLFELVKEGVKDLDKQSALTPNTSNDLIYGYNSVNGWKQAGNTLLLKMANTISRRDPALATTIINEVLQSGIYIEDNDDDLEFYFGTTVGNTNPYYSFLSNRPNDQVISRTIIDSMDLRNDPRLPRFFVSVNNRIRYNTYIVGTRGEAPVRLITNFQRAFILAESALILKTKGDPQELYEEGIRASMDKAGVSANDIDDYFAASENQKWVRLSGSDAQKLNQIITQKWIAFLGMGQEAYNDYRRTGYPRLNLVPDPNPVSPTAIPVRFLYPTSETTSNSNSIPNPLPQLNTRVWWDVD